MYLLIIFVFTLLIPFLVIPKHIKLNILPPYRVVLLSTISVAVVALVVFMIASFTGQGVYAQLHEVAKIVTEEAATNPMIAEMLGTDSMSKEEIAKTLLQMYDMMFLSLPVGIMLTGAIVSYIAYIILSRLFSRKYEVKLMPKFREFTFPHGTAMAVMIMYIVGWLMVGGETTMGDMVYANFNMLFDIVFVLQGVATVMMFFHFKKVPQIVAVIVCIIMCTTSIGKTFVVLLGMADLFFGLRIRMGGGIAGR